MIITLLNCIYKQLNFFFYVCTINNLLFCLYFLLFLLLVCFEDSDCAIIIICTLISFTGTTGFYYDFCLYFISILLPSNDYTTGICSKVCTFVIPVKMTRERECDGNKRWKLGYEHWEVTNLLPVIPIIPF